MKNKSFHKYLLCLLTGMLVVGGISVYAVSTIIDSKEVSYDNENSSGSYDNVQASIDELYQRYKDLSGEQDTIYTEKILNGADPVLGDGMIPVTLDSKGNVKYANLYTPWYSYEEKRWANAVILVKEPSKQYKPGDTILEKDIESYFVWIPRYKYKIWDDGNYTYSYSTGATGQQYKIADGADVAESSKTAIRRMTGNARIISIIFEDKNTTPSTSTTVGSYYTHPAFTNFGVNGLWVGKFETGYNQGTVGKPIEDTSEWTTTGAEKNIVESSYTIIKPNVYSWRGQNIGTMFNNSYNYNRTLDSHMIKNTEWGAIAYLSHSAYGIGNEVNINNNSDLKTGYSAVPGTDQSSYPGEYGTTSDITEAYNTTTGHLASTTGNITGIYDMSGGAWEITAGYMDGYEIKNVNNVPSGITATDLSKTQYFDKYPNNSSHSTLNLHIKGDATGEIGPVYYFYDRDKQPRNHSSWYYDYCLFLYSGEPWFERGGTYIDGCLSGELALARYTGEVSNMHTSRLVLAVK